jgi:hypothetical protein
MLGKAGFNTSPLDVAACWSHTVIFEVVFTCGWRDSRLPGARECKVLHLVLAMNLKTAHEWQHRMMSCVSVLLALPPSSMSWHLGI